jgi:hypothetical protein
MWSPLRLGNIPETSSLTVQIRPEITELVAQQETCSSQT